jgi:hypothetical protein
VGKLLLLVVLVLVAVAGYNGFVFGVVQPFPLSWNHSADELRLIDLERERGQLASRLGAGQRVTSLAGVPQVGAPADDEKAALARLDAEIATLRARIEAAAR